jgi:hypothetical protein
MVKLRARNPSLASFTLVEMVVSMAVLVLLVLVVVKIVDFSVQLTDSTGRNADSGIESKQILDRIGSDIAGMVNRIDVDQFYYKAAGNDKMFFYSQQAGFFNTNASSYYAGNQSSVSLVGYRVTSNTADSPSGLPVLERLARGLTAGPDLDADGGPYTLPLQYLSFPAATSPILYQAAVGGAITNVWGPSEAALGNIQGAGPAGDVGTLGGNFDDGSSPYYHIVGNDVFRFEICFQVQNGSSAPFYSPFPGYTNSAPVYPASITNTTAIVVAIAVLDAKSRQIVPAASWTRLISALQDPTAAELTANPPVLMASLWNSELPSIAATAGIPVPAASHIKVYQRCYYLNAPKNQ